MCNAEDIAKPLHSPCIVLNGPFKGKDFLLIPCLMTIEALNLLTQLFIFLLETNEPIILLGTTLFQLLILLTESIALILRIDNRIAVDTNTKLGIVQSLILLGKLPVLCINMRLQVANIALQSKGFGVAPLAGIVACAVNGISGHGSLLFIGVAEWAVLGAWHRLLPVQFGQLGKCVLCRPTSFKRSMPFLLASSNKL